MWTAGLFIDNCDAEPELAGVFWSELSGLEFDNDVSELFDVKEQQVDEEVVAVEVDLAADAGETSAELAHGVDDPFNETAFRFPLGDVAIEGEDVQDLRVFSDLLRELGIGLRERLVEVGWCGREAGMCAGPDLMFQHRSGPAVARAVFGQQELHRPRGRHRDPRGPARPR